LIAKTLKKECYVVTCIKAYKFTVHVLCVCAILYIEFASSRMNKLPVFIAEQNMYFVTGKV